MSHPWYNEALRAEATLEAMTDDMDWTANAQTEYSRLPQAQQIHLQIEYRRAYIRKIEGEIKALEGDLYKVRQHCQHDWLMTMDRGSHGVEKWFECRHCRMMRR